MILLSVNFLENVHILQICQKYSNPCIPLTYSYLTLFKRQGMVCLKVCLVCLETTNRIMFLKCYSKYRSNKLKRVSICLNCLWPWFYSFSDYPVSPGNGLKTDIVMDVRCVRELCWLNPCINRYLINSAKKGSNLDTYFLDH